VQFINKYDHVAEGSSLWVFAVACWKSAFDGCVTLLQWNISIPFRLFCKS
jgi:hypothetical protein